MNKLLRIALCVAVCGLVVAASATLQAETGITLVGLVLEDDQIVDEDGNAYTVIPNDASARLFEAIGSRVRVRGLLSDDDPTAITIVDFVVIEE